MFSKLKCNNVLNGESNKRLRYGINSIKFHNIIFIDYLERQISLLLSQKIVATSTETSCNLSYINFAVRLKEETK